MGFKTISTIILIVVFLLGMAIHFTESFTIKWGVESVFAKNDDDQGEDNDDQGKNKVPEPSTLILLGVGLTAVGGYAAFKLKNKRKK